MEEADLTALDTEYENIFTEDERDEIINEFKYEKAPDLYEHVDELESDYNDPDEDPDWYFSDFRTSLEDVSNFYGFDKDVESHVEYAIDAIESAIERINESNEEIREEEAKEEAERLRLEEAMRELAELSEQMEDVAASAPTETKTRSIFDDIDA